MKPAPMWLRYLRQLRRLIQPFAPDPVAYVQVRGGKIVDMRVVDDGGKLAQVMHDIERAADEADQSSASLHDLVESLNTGREHGRGPINDDTFHERIALSFQQAAFLGQINEEANGLARWRLSWICSKCSEVHYQHGTLHQIVSSFIALIQFGYPWLKIENAAFVEIAGIEGLDPNDTLAVSEAYRRFLDATQP